MKMDKVQVATQASSAPRDVLKVLIYDTGKLELIGCINGAVIQEAIEGGVAEQLKELRVGDSRNPSSIDIPRKGIESPVEMDEYVRDDGTIKFYKNSSNQLRAGKAPKDGAAWVDDPRARVEKALAFGRRRR